MPYLHNDSTQINSGCANGDPKLLHAVKGETLYFFFNDVPLLVQPPLQGIDQRRHKRNVSITMHSKHLIQLLL